MLVEVEQTGDPLQRTFIVGLDAEFLAQLLVIRQQICGFDRERLEPRTGISNTAEAATIAPVDVTAAVKIG